MNTQKRNRIKVSDLIGSRLCISSEDGERVFEKIKDLISNDENVVVSFENVDMLISLFLNVAIGQLYGALSENLIRERLEVEGLCDDDKELLKRVVENAKRYYSNKSSYDEAWLEEEDG